MNQFFEDFEDDYLPKSLKKKKTESSKVKKMKKEKEINHSKPRKTK